MMWKQAWRSYLASLHPRYLRKAYDEGKLFWLLYWLVIYPTIMSSATESLEIYEVIYLTMLRMISFLIMSWSNINSKFLMPKMMFLCPIKEEERQEYINDVLIIKIGVSVFLGMLIEVLYGLFNSFSVIKILIMALANFSMGIATYISLETFGKVDEKIYALIKDKAEHTKHHWINHFVIVVAMLIIVAFSLLDVGAEESLAIFLQYSYVVMTIFLIVFDIVIIRKEYKPTIILAGDYELSFRILGKVEKQVKFDLFQK